MFLLAAAKPIAREVVARKWLVRKRRSSRIAWLFQKLIVQGWWITLPVVVFLFFSAWMGLLLGAGCFYLHRKQVAREDALLEAEKARLGGEYAYRLKGYILRDWQRHVFTVGLAPRRSALSGAGVQRAFAEHVAGAINSLERRAFGENPADFIFPVIDEFLPSPLGLTIDVHMVVGQTEQDYANRAEQLAAAFGVPAVRVKAGRPGHALVTFVVTDPLAEIIRLPADYAVTPVPVTEPWVVGVDESGTNVVYDLANSAHLLIAGATRSGKSVCTYSLLTHLGRMGTGVRVLVADPNDTTVAPFVGKVSFSTTETHPDTVTEMLQWVRAEMDRRKPLLREMQQDKLNPEDFTEAVPLIVVVIDELANYLRHSDKKAAAALEGELLAVASQGAKFGIRLVLITQRPDSTILSTAIRSQLSGRLVFRLEDKETALMAFPGFETPTELLGLDLGVGFVSFIGDLAPRRFRGLYIPDHWTVAGTLPPVAQIELPNPESEED